MNEYCNNNMPAMTVNAPIDNIDSRIPTITAAANINAADNTAKCNCTTDSVYYMSTECYDDDNAELVTEACENAFGCRVESVVEIETSKRVMSALNDGLFSSIDRTGVYIPPISNIKFKNGATIIQFSDGTKTVVRPSKNDEFDYEKGVLYALVKRLYGEFDPETGEFTTEGFSRKIGTLVKSALDVDKKKTVDEVLNPEKYAKLKEKAEAEKARIEKIRENHFIRKIKRQARHDAKYDMLREKFYKKYCDEMSNPQD